MSRRSLGLRHLPRNIWAVGATSFLMDVSSEMVLNLLPLFLANVLGVGTTLIGVIEGVAEATASLVKVFSGWLSDRLGQRKWLAVAGYALSAAAKPFLYIASSWEAVAGVRWADRVGKGIRTAPRDALVADSIDEKRRGLAFGFHRAADTGGRCDSRAAQDTARPLPPHPPHLPRDKSPAQKRGSSPLLP